MTKHTVNLLGVLALVAILAAGALLGVLPRWQAAADARTERDTVAGQNDQQELVVAATRAEAERLPVIRADVALLQEQVPASDDLEQVVALAVSAERKGAVLRSVVPLEVEEAPAPAPAEDATDGSAPASGEPSAGAGFEEVPVSIVVDLDRPGRAAKVLDGLREGPRLLAIDTVTLAEADASTDRKYSLTVTGRVFTHQEEQ